MDDIKNVDMLVEGIVLQAVRDYRNALRGRGYNHKSALSVIIDCEKFFTSDWFGMLCPTIDGSGIITKLKKEYEDEIRNRKNSYA